MGYEGYGGKERGEGYERRKERLDLGGGEVVPSLVMACDGQFLLPQFSGSRIAEGRERGGRRGGRRTTQRKEGCERRVTGQDKNSSE